VCNPAYFHIEFEPLVVAESSAQEDYEPSLEPVEWTNEEISAIRIALQKLTAHRILNTNDAEDLVQDTLLTMIAKCPGNELVKGPMAWSMGVLRKKVGNYYRKVQRCAWINKNEASADRPLESARHRASPEVQVINKELQEIIGKKLAALPPSQRQVMELLVSGLDTWEIVEQLHPERYQNVINRLYRGRKRLARELVKAGYRTRTGAGPKRMKNKAARTEK
jgi:RNA polymerase sigma factor (sigma-70 family)